MICRHTRRWLALFVVVALAAGGWYVYDTWIRSDEILRQLVLRELDRYAPGWKFDLHRAQFDFQQRIRLYHLTLRTQDEAEPILSIPETIITIDPEKLTETQQIEIQRVVCKKTRIHLARDAEGVWNWRELASLPDSRASLPEFQIEDSSVTISVDRQTQTAPASVRFENIGVRLVPSGKRQFIVQGSTQIDRAGKLKVDGWWNLDAKTWSVEGVWDELSAGSDLLRLVAGLSPEFDARLRTFFANRVESIPPPALAADNARPVPGAAVPVSLPGKPPQPSKTDNDERRRSFTRLAADLGVSAQLNTRFKLGRESAGGETSFEVRAQVSDGQVINPQLPFALHDLSGEVVWNNQQLSLIGFSASNGVTRLRVDGVLKQLDDTMGGQFDLSATNLAIDYRLRGALPYEPFGRLFDMLQPSGYLDVTMRIGNLHEDPKDRRWRPADTLITIRQGGMAHVLFPYPLHHLSGEVIQHGNRLDVSVEGKAGQRDVTIVGAVRNPGPEAESVLDVHVEKLPLDGNLVAACQGKSRDVMRSMNLSGSVDADLRFVRPPGPGKATDLGFSCRLNSVSMQLEAFPYRIAGIGGTVTYSSHEQKWEFRELQGVHDSAQIKADGSFVKQDHDAPGLLQLKLQALGASFDKQLEMALPPTLQAAWDELSPEGDLSLRDVDIRWLTDQPLEVKLPDVTVANGAMLLKSFALPLEDVQGRFAFADGRLTIQSLSATHDETQLQANGYGLFQEQGWTLRFAELRVDDLMPDRVFRRALPAGLRTFVESIDPKGLISLSGMLEFRGTPNPQDPVTTAWDLETILSGGKMVAGLDFENVHGRILSKGTWNGREVDLVGWLDIDSLVVWGYQIAQVEGPYELHGLDLFLGSETAGRKNVKRVPGLKPFGNDRIRGLIVGGEVSVDGTVRLEDVVDYHLLLTLTNGKLEEYAKRYLAGQRNLNGVVNAWVDLSGKGSLPKDLVGEGQIQISPAALYELPVMVQTFKVLSFVPPDKTAFHYAWVDFEIGRERMFCKTIDLVGDAISLRGRGDVTFDGRLGLSFYSMLPRHRLPFPLVGPLLGEATKGWVGVDVHGHLRDPVAQIKAVPSLDGAMKGFLKAFEQASPVAPPRLNVPPWAMRSTATAPPARRNR